MAREKINICTIGGASQDVFLGSDEFDPKKEGKVAYTHLPLGAKLDVEKAIFSTGGGATNAAVTFARQAMFTTFMGKIGHDLAGEAVLKVLDMEDIYTKKVMYSTDVGTQYSTILLSDTGERTILIYRGASHTHEKKDYINVDFSSYEWLYISSLAGSMEALKTIVQRAHEAGVQVAVNPGEGELSQKQEFLELLPYINLISVNKEEASSLVSGDKTQDLVRELSKSVRYVLVSDGPNGAVASDGENMVIAGMYEDVPVVDRTGAGDAFSSGFVSQIARGEPLEYAVTFASANSTSVVSKVGSKTGILRGKHGLHEMPLQTKPLQLE